MLEISVIMSGDVPGVSGLLTVTPLHTELSCHAGVPKPHHSSLELLTQVRLFWSFHALPHTMVIDNLDSYMA